MAPPNQFRSPLPAARYGCCPANDGSAAAFSLSLRTMKSSWMYIGFSHHSVPSLSNTATRASGATYSGPSVVTRPTKSTIADFVGPSFQVESSTMCSAATGSEELLELLYRMVDRERRWFLTRRELLERLEEL